MLIIADKPQGITSFDVIRRLKWHFKDALPDNWTKRTKIGHSGTLDPMATGTMLIGTHKDTKRLQELTKLGKCYEATIDLSQMTDTWDADAWDKHEKYEVTSEGIIKDEATVAIPELSTIEKLLQSITPGANMPLPAFSAKKKDGKKLYDLARKGEIEQEYRDMVFHEVKIIDYIFPEVKIWVDVGSGAYIRSIAYWLGLQLGTGGILTSLRRTSIGDYQLDDYNLDLEKEGVKFKIIEDQIT